MGSIPLPLLIIKERPLWSLSFIGAADRNRTGTDFTPRDFKSLVSTYSTTAAYSFFISLWLMDFTPRDFKSCCGARQLRRRQCGCVSCRPFVVPGSFLAASGCVICRPRHTLYPRCICHRQRSGSRPRPLTRLPLPATGGGRLVPPCVYPFHHSGRKPRYSNTFLPTRQGCARLFLLKISQYLPYKQRKDREFFRLFFVGYGKFSKTSCKFAKNVVK